MNEDLLSSGYDAAVALALGLRGDLARIIGHRPVIPGGLDADEQHDWSTGFACGRIDLTDLLLPDGMILEQLLAEHQPDEADHQAVLALAEGQGPISQLRTGLARRELAQTAVARVLSPARRSPLMWPASLVSSA